MVKGVCLRYSKNEQEAEDLMQDSFIKVFNNLKAYTGKGAFGGWIRTLTVNTALELYRKNKAKSIDVINIVHLAEDEIIENLELEDLLKKIQQLPPGFRTVFNLYAVEGYNHREIGEMLNISSGTSKSQYSRARLLLRQMIYTELEQEKTTLKYAK